MWREAFVVFAGDGRIVTAILRPGKRPTGKEIRAHLRRIVRAIRANWPQVSILLRGDGHYTTPEVLSWCRANGVEHDRIRPSSDFCCSTLTPAGRPHKPEADWFDGVDDRCPPA